MTIEADKFIDAALLKGFDFYTGVPCSFLTPFINRTISKDNIDYIAANNEGDAVAIAAGATLAGRKTVVMFQNSGLGNAVNPLTSLNYCFKIPSLIITTWRGQPSLVDEPQHELMGQITHKMLELMQIGSADFPHENSMIEECLDQAGKFMAESSLPFAFIMKKGSIYDEKINDTGFKKNNSRTKVKNLYSNKAVLPARIDILHSIINFCPKNYPIIATTGKTGRELFTISDSEQNLYQVGSMGCVSSFGLGVALSINKKNKVIVIDGDGSLLMRMGAMVTVGAYHPKNFVHIVLDNAVHDSTGAQSTVSPVIDFLKLAEACSYAAAFGVDDEDSFKRVLHEEIDDIEGPVLIHVKIKQGSLANLGRPTIKPEQVALRFSNYLKKL